MTHSSVVPLYLTHDRYGDDLWWSGADLGGGVTVPVAGGRSAAECAGFEVRFFDGLDAAVGERRLPLAAVGGVRFERVPPVRRFPSYQGQRNFPGEWWSATSGELVGFESWLERDQVMFLDFCAEVVAFSSQPFWLTWRDGRLRRHASDYCARLSDGSAVVIDVRPDDRIGDEDARVFELTRGACEAVGWSYRRIEALPPVLAANLRWLAGYRHPRCRNLEYAVVLSPAFSEPGPLLATAHEVGDRIAVLPTLFHLL